MNINEQTIHEKMANIELKLLSLKDALEKLCILMSKNKLYHQKVVEINEMITSLDNMKLQLNYFDEVIKDAKLQRENKPLIIEEEKE